MGGKIICSYIKAICDGAKTVCDRFSGDDDDE